jgi:hypothetical protein
MFFRIVPNRCCLRLVNSHALPIASVAANPPYNGVKGVRQGAYAAIAYSTESSVKAFAFI